MVEGEFLSADDLGPLGRLVAPGEMRLFEKRDVPEMMAERRWITERYLAADERAERFRRRLKTARMGEHRDAVRWGFEEWTLEAAKLAFCDQCLLRVVGHLDLGRRQAMELPEAFRLRETSQIAEVTRRVLAASDQEIADGMTFRVA